MKIIGKFVGINSLRATTIISSAKKITGNIVPINIKCNNFYNKV